MLCTACRNGLTNPPQPPSLPPTAQIHGGAPGRLTAPHTPPNNAPPPTYQPPSPLADNAGMNPWSATSLSPWLVLAGGGPSPGAAAATSPSGTAAPLGVGGSQRGWSRLPLEDVEGRLPVFCRGGRVHGMPCEVLHHRPACVELVCTQVAFLGSVAPLGERSGTDLRTELSGARLKGRLASGNVCGTSVRPGADVSRALAVGAGPRPQMAVCCASGCSHTCQFVGPTWQSGLLLHRRSWKAWS